MTEFDTIREQRDIVTGLDEVHKLVLARARQDEAALAEAEAPAQRIREDGGIHAPPARRCARQAAGARAAGRTFSGITSSRVAKHSGRHMSLSLPLKDDPRMQGALEQVGDEQFAQALCDFIDQYSKDPGVAGTDVVHTLDAVATGLFAMGWGNSR
jgi:hypothetical protein